MDTETKQQLVKRLKSFAWRAGAFVVVAGIGAIIDMLGIAQVNPTIITVVSLIGGEITKYVNTYAKN